MTIGLVTDSTSCLRDGEAGAAVVSLEVLAAANGAPLRDGIDISGTQLARLLATGAQYTTSRPAPHAFVERYNALIAAGATQIVSVHLAAALSRTLESAQLAARQVQVPVHVVDSGLTGMGTGFAVRFAHDRIAGGADAASIVVDLERFCAETRVWVGVESLEQLRRGGRLGATRAVLATAARVRPLLTFDNGELVLAERVIGSARLDARLRELAVARVQAGNHRAQVAVQHAAAEERARALAAALEAHLPGVAVEVRDAGAAIAAHLGAGAVAVVVAPLTIG